MRQIEAKEFNAKCAKLVNEVSESGQPIIITKDGVAVARLIALPELSGSGDKKPRSKK